MIHRASGWLVSFVMVVGMALVVLRAEDDTPSHDRAVSRAIALLSRRPVERGGDRR